MRLSPTIALWHDPLVCQSRAHRADSSHARAANGRRSRFHPRKPDPTPTLLPTLSRTPPVPPRRAPGNSNSFFATPAQTMQRPRKRHRRQRHACLLLPHLRHLAQRGVCVIAHKRFKYLTPQRTGASATNWCLRNAWRGAIRCRSARAGTATHQWSNGSHETHGAPRFYSSLHPTNATPALVSRGCILSALQECSSKMLNYYMY